MEIKVRSKRKENRYYIDNEFLNGYAKKVGWQGHIVYSALCRHEKKGKAFPGFRHLAEELGVSKGTIGKGVELLKEYNIIQVEKGKQNKFTYWLTDYTDWKYIDKWSNRPQDGQTVRRVDDTVHVVGHNNTNKQTNKQYITKVIEKPLYGNQDINNLILLLKEKFNLGILDGSDKENRRYCWLALKKFKKEGIELIIEAGSRDTFWASKITGFKTLYYNGIKIASTIKGRKANIISI